MGTLRISLSVVVLVSVVVLALAMSGCGQSTQTPIEFMYNNPGTKLQIGPDIYDRYSTAKELQKLSSCAGDVVLRVHMDGKIYDVLLTSKWHRIGDTRFKVARGT